MVGAHERLGGPLLLRANAKATMPAGVVKSADRPLFVSEHDDGRSADRGRQVRTRLIEFRLETDQIPGSAEDGLQVQFEDIRIHVESLRKRVPGETLAKKGGYAITIVHIGSLCTSREDVGG